MATTTEEPVEIKNNTPQRLGAALALLLLLLLLALLLANCMGNQEIYTHTFASYAAPDFGLVIDDKLQVVEVEVNSAAQKAGIKTGDTLESIDNTTLATPKDARDAARQAVTTNRSATFVLNRNGQKLSLQVAPGSTSGRGPNSRPGATATPVPSNYGYL